MEHATTERKRRLFLRIICGLVMLAFAVSLLPLLAEAKYNLPISDDITVISKVAGVWDETHSLPAFLSACVADCVHYYMTWQGTYAANFVVEVLDVLLLRQYPMLTPWLGLTVFVAAVAFFFWVLLKRVLCTDTCTWLTLTFLALILMIQFCPSVYEGFYWLFSMLLYVWSFAGALVLIGAALAARRADGKGAKALFYALAFLAALYVGGGAQLLLPPVALLLVYNLFACMRERSRFDVVLAAVLLAVHLAGSVLNATAPGNFVRLDYETGAAVAAMSPVKAVLLSCVHAFGAVLNRFDPAMLLFLLATAVLTLPFIRTSTYAYRRPWLVVILSFGVYASLFMALIYSKNHVGPLRARNLYYFALYPLMGLNVVYCIGAAIRAYERRTGTQWMPAAGESFLNAAFQRPVVTCLVIACLAFAMVIQQGLRRTWSYAAWQDLSSGWARDYYHARRLELDGTDPLATQNVTLPNITYGS